MQDDSSLLLSSLSYIELFLSLAIPKTLLLIRMYSPYLAADKQYSRLNGMQSRSVACSGVSVVGGLAF